MSGTQLYASTDFRELFRYQKDEHLRAYNLRVLADDSAEVWVLSTSSGTPAGSEKAGTFSKPEKAMTFLKAEETRLKSGGWSEA